MYRSENIENNTIVYIYMCVCATVELLYMGKYGLWHMAIRPILGIQTEWAHKSRSNVSIAIPFYRKTTHVHAAG